MRFQLVEGGIGGYKDGHRLVILQHGTKVGLLQDGAHNGHIRPFPDDVHDVLGQRLKNSAQGVDESLLRELVVLLDGHTVGGKAVGFQVQGRRQLVAVDPNLLVGQLRLQKFFVGHILQLNLAEDSVQFVDGRF